MNSSHPTNDKTIPYSATADPRGHKTNGVAVGICWMFGISILLFFLPLLGPFIAGIVGGRKSGGVLNAIMAALLPSLALASILLTFTSLITGIPIIGAIATWGAIAMAFAGGGPLLVGAIIGGALAVGNEEPVSGPAMAVVLILSSFMAWRVYSQVTNTVEQMRKSVSFISNIADGASAILKDPADSAHLRFRAVHPESMDQAIQKTKSAVHDFADEMNAKLSEPSTAVNQLGILAARTSRAVRKPKAPQAGTEVKGSCWTISNKELNAYRCEGPVPAQLKQRFPENTYIYDPCFKSDDSNYVVCNESGVRFPMRLTAPLPQ